MAPLEAEWMLWAKRLNYEHKVLLHRLDTAEHATAQIGPLSEQIKDLLTEHNSIKERFLSLEEHMVDGEKAVGTDIINLQGVVGELEKEIVSVVGDLNDWKKDCAQILDKGRVIQDGRWQKPRSTDVLPISGRAGSRRTRRATSKPLSQANSRVSSISAARDEVKTRGHPRDSIGLTAQGESTLEEYFTYGESAIRRAIQMYETRAVKAFVSGIREKHQQEIIWEILDEEGWSWQNARKVLRKLPLKDRRKGNRKRSTRGIDAPTKRS